MPHNHSILYLASRIYLIFTLIIIICLTHIYVYVCICNDNQAPTNEQLPQRTFASNWSILTFIVSVLGAAGGLLVAATLKYADSILKTLATAGAIVISTVLGHYFLNGPLDLVIIIGALTAIIAIADYTLDSTPSYIELMTPKDLEKQ